MVREYEAYQLVCTLLDFFSEMRPMLDYDTSSLVNEWLEFRIIQRPNDAIPANKSLVT